MAMDRQRVGSGASASPGHALRLARIASAPVPLAALMVISVVAVLSSIAGDSRWLALMARHAFDGSPMTQRVPNASAPSLPWPNVPLLAELIARGASAVCGDRGWLVLHVLAVAVGIGVLAADMSRASLSRRGAVAALLLVLAAGMLTALLFIRLSLFSVALLPVVLALLHDQARRPSQRVWLLVPLLALWSNLHGAALVGLLVTGAYLLLHRAREEPLLALAVAAASTGAVLLLTPALWRTPVYYWRALHTRQPSSTSGCGRDCRRPRPSTLCSCWRSWPAPSSWCAAARRCGSS
jgi:hypothetical protein